MTVDLWMPYMLMIISTTLTLMQGHSGLAKAKNQHCMLSATKQAISIKLATMVGWCFFFTWPWLCKCLYGFSTLLLTCMDALHQVDEDEKKKKRMERFGNSVSSSPTEAKKVKLNSTEGEGEVRWCLWCQGLGSSQTVPVLTVVDPVTRQLWLRLIAGLIGICALSITMHAHCNKMTKPC